MEAFKDQRDVGTLVNGVTDFKCEVRFDLQGCLEAVVSSEAAKRAHTI